jgi:hypothetical protein
MAAMTASEEKRAEILDGKIVADAIKKEVTEEVRRLKATAEVTPALAAVLVGDDPASAVYVRNKVRACEEVGIISRQLVLRESISREELLHVVKELNEDDELDGILVQLPLPKQIDDSLVIEAIDPAKDVDAFHPRMSGCWRWAGRASCRVRLRELSSYSIEIGLKLPCANACVVGPQSNRRPADRQPFAATSRDGDDLSFQNARLAQCHTPG